MDVGDNQSWDLEVILNFLFKKMLFFHFWLMILTGGVMGGYFYRPDPEIDYFYGEIGPEATLN